MTKISAAQAYANQVKADRRAAAAERRGAAIKADDARVQALYPVAPKAPVKGKQPVEGKLHYRWVSAEIELQLAHTDLQDGEMLAQTIIGQEVLKALSLHQPALDRPDTTQRFKFVPYIASMVATAAVFGRATNCDFVAVRDGLKAQFPEDWNAKWDKAFAASKAAPALSGAQIDQFRAFVRAEIDRLTCEIYPSVRKRLAA